MQDVADAYYPALRERTIRADDPRLEAARRELWKAYQHGILTEEELARTLQRLRFGDGRF